MADNINELLQELHKNLLNLQTQAVESQSTYFKNIIQPTINLIASIKDKTFSFDPKTIKKQLKEFEAHFRDLEKIFDPRPKRGIPQILYQDTDTLLFAEDLHSAQLTEYLLSTLNQLKALGEKNRALNVLLQMADRKLSKTEQFMQFRLARLKHNQSFSDQSQLATTTKNSIDVNEWVAKLQVEGADWVTILNELSDKIKEVEQLNLPYRVPHFNLDESNPNDLAILDFSSMNIGGVVWQKIATLLDTVKNTIEIPQQNNAQFEAIEKIISEKMNFSSELAKVAQARDCLSTLKRNIEHQVKNHKPNFFSSSITKYMYNMLRRIQHSLSLADTTFDSVIRNPNSPTADELLGQQIRIVIKELDTVTNNLLYYVDDKGKKPKEALSLYNLLTPFVDEIQTDVNKNFPLPQNNNNFNL